MKKMLAVLLAMMLALSCTLAMAESVDYPGFQGVTIQSEYDVDRDVLKDVLTQVGVDDAILTIADTVASVLDQAGSKLVVSDAGAQAELLLKGTSLVNAVAVADESGLTLGSNLIPNYAVKISFEELGNMFSDLAQQIGSLDLDAAQQAIGTYIESFIETCASAVATGNPETGDYDVNGASYNIMIPVDVDLVSIVEAANKLSEQLQGDESVKAALNQLAGLGFDVSLGDASEPVDTATLPTVKGEVYASVDEDGEQTGTTLVVVNVIPSGETDPATVVYVTSEGANVTIDANFLTADTQLSFAAETDPADPMSMSCRLDAYVQDFYAGFAAVTTSDGNQGLVYDGYVYVLDTEKPLISEHGSITMGGALTLGIPDNATVLGLVDLTGENAGDAAEGLQGDLLGGAFSVLGNAIQLMPDEVGAIMGMLQGGSDAPAA